MRGKMAALKKGRIPSDDEFTSILLDDSDAVPGRRHLGTDAPDEEEEEEGEEGEEGEEEEEEGDGQELEGENPEADQDLNAQVDHLMKNLLEQSQEHQSICVLLFVLTVVTSLGSSSAGRPKMHLDDEFEGIYGDDDDD
jgi:hypothetical protein